MIISENKFKPFLKMMRAEGIPDIFIDTFRDYYIQLISGETGLIPEGDISPVEHITQMETLAPNYESIGLEALSKTAVIKLNGGLGTSMGLKKAKSLLLVKEDNSFLDIIAKQMIHAGVPLILMNSFVTEEDSLNVLEKYPKLTNDISLSFMQHKEPKVTKDAFQPVDWPNNRSYEWCPPGHGDIYTALVTRNILPELLDKGIRYVFVSNADNLGAVLDKKLLGYFVKNNYPFMMEVAERTESDRKGGHLAIRKQDGNFILRESAQCPDNDLEAFQDISRHKFFNTNNLWLNLESLSTVMSNQDNKLGLPMIRNSKTVDPQDSGSTAVYQIETAMGSAIGVFPNAQAVQVPRTRFAPVKKTVDLLAVRSDAYELTDDFRIVLNPERNGIPPIIEFDDRYYKFIQDLDGRFPDGGPSLKDCSQLSVTGDVLFEKGVICRGAVAVINDTSDQLIIREGTLLEG